MNIDVFTLFLVHSVVSLTLGGLMLVFWTRHHRLAGFGLWTIATLLLGAGTMLAAMRGAIPDLLSIMVANAAVATSLVCFLNGNRTFNGRPARWRAEATVVAVLLAFLAYRTFADPYIPDRVVAVSLVLSAGCLLNARELLHGTAPGLRTTGWTAAAVFALVGATLLARAAATYANPPEPDVFGRLPAHAVHFLVSIISSIMIVFCLLMMAAQRLNRQVEQHGARLQEALLRTEEASNAKAQFLAMMSHELRTPLNAIIGFSEMQRREILGPMGNPRYREYADDINASGTHLLGLINSILDISKAEAGKLEVTLRPVDPVPIAHEILKMVAHDAAAKGITVEREVADPAAPCIADAQALRQILLNLLSNAIKFTPEGGTVSLGVAPDGAGRVAFVVRDTGIGIRPDEMPRLLRPFEQSSNAYGRANKGTGLGLPIVDALVALQGGVLRIESRPGRGTTVSFLLREAL